MASEGKPAVMEKRCAGMRENRRFIRAEFAALYDNDFRRTGFPLPKRPRHFSSAGSPTDRAQGLRTTEPAEK